MQAILKRELKSYFYNPLGYIFIAVYYLFTGFFFFNFNLYGNTNDMRELFDTLFLITLFLVPILTMRLLSEEKKMRTNQLLLMSPILSFQVVAGKFIAAVIVYIAGISGTLLAAFVLQLLNPPDWPVFAGHFIGLLLLGTALISIGIFCSSLTENQIVASVTGFCVSFFVMLLDNVAAMINSQKIAAAVRAASFHTRYSPFTLGNIGLDNVIFFVSIAIFFVAVTTSIFESQRWA